MMDRIGKLEAAGPAEGGGGGSGGAGLDALFEGIGVSRPFSTDTPFSTDKSRVSSASHARFFYVRQTLTMWWKIAQQKSKDDEGAAVVDEAAAAAPPAKKGVCVCVCVCVCVFVCKMLNALFLLHSCLSFCLVPIAARAGAIKRTSIKFRHQLLLISFFLLHPIFCCELRKDTP
jgi:hypothetical protein